MSLEAKPSASNPSSVLEVTIPPTRSDILHACDIMEDVAIAYSYNKIKETMPKSSTIAVPLPINKLTDLLRKECAFAGFTEALAFTLCSHDENFKFLRKVDGGKEAVVLANPKTLEYQV
jgi:phenylalanyl-tRNA synthetase beta chain